MSFDLAIDYTTGDLIMAPNHDILGRTGPDVYEQRIRIRLKIKKETWISDPTDGELGSNLLDLARVSAARAAGEMEQYVREAIEPMDDIILGDIDAQIDPENPRAVMVSISYQPRLDEGEEDAGTMQSISLTIPT